MRMSDWSSDVCSSDLDWISKHAGIGAAELLNTSGDLRISHHERLHQFVGMKSLAHDLKTAEHCRSANTAECLRSEEHTSELQSLIRNSYAVYCLKKKIQHINKNTSISHEHPLNYKH